MPDEATAKALLDEIANCKPTRCPYKNQTDTHSCLSHGTPTAVADSAHCRTEGVWVEILGAGSGGRRWTRAASFLLWQDNVARLIVDTGSAHRLDLIVLVLISTT